MDKAEVAVRRPQHTDEKPRVGKVLSRTQTLATIQWDDDGSVEEKVRLGSHTEIAVLGTLRHQSFADHAALAERFTRDPMSVIVDLLRESSNALKAILIKKKLINLGLEQDAVDKAWRSTYAKLSRRDDIAVISNAYKWVGSAEEQSGARAAKGIDGGGGSGAPVLEGVERLSQLDRVAAPVDEGGRADSADAPIPEKPGTVADPHPESLS